MNAEPLDPPRDGCCPFCGSDLETWEPSPFHAWQNDLQFCPSDDCSYFRFGRKAIAERFQKNFGYRYCWDPVGAHAFPLIAWCGGSRSYLKGRCPA